MTTNNRIEILAMIAIAFTASGAFAAAPTIVSGTGSLTVDANGAYVLDCPSGCGIDFGTTNSTLIVPVGSMLTDVTGSALGISSLDLNAFAASGGTTGTIGGGFQGSGITVTNTGTVNSVGGTLTLNNGGSLSLTGNTGTPTVSTTGISLTSATGQTGTILVNGLTGSTGTTLTNTGTINTTGGTLIIGNDVTNNGTTLSTTDTTILTGVSTSFPDSYITTEATPNPFDGGFTNTGAVGLTGTALTDEIRISWNGTTLFAPGTFALVIPTDTGINRGSASVSVYGVADVSYDSITNSTLITPGDIANAGGSISIGNGIFLSTTAQGTVVATLGPNGPILPTANITADPATFSSWLNDNALVTNTQVESIGTLIRSGLNSVLFGSHHRILLDNGMTDTGSGFWATGDFARHDPNNTDASIGEFGVYKDVTPTLRLGAGVGVNQARQGLPLNGSGKLDSRYLVLEGDYRAIESGWTGSATVYLGSNRSTISRGYMVGIAPNLSSGDANGSSWAIRLRSDWRNVATLQEWDVSPYLAYTHAESRLDGYTETGGALPVAFAAQKQTSDELRAGVTLLSRLSEQTDLRFPLELAHRSNGGTVVTGVAAATPFSFSNAGGTQDWGRAGIELDHRLNKQTVLNGAALFASRGGDSSWLATIGLRHAF